MRVTPSPGEESPSGTTGDGLTQVLVRHDWLNVTAPLPRLAQVREVMERWLGPAQARDRGANTYARSVGFESGALLAWSEGRPECWLSVNGDSCDLIPVSAKRALFRELRSLGCKCTRLDLALDCTRDLLSMDLVHQAAMAGQVVGFKRYDPHRPIDMSTGKLDRDQANFGRRGRDGSGRYTRIYDKGIESNGSLDCIRVETEFSGDMAATIFDLLCMCQEHEFEREAGRFAAGAIDFADKSAAHGHRDRFERLPWWDRICSLVSSARVRVERVKPSLERAAAWVMTVLPTTFARFERAVDAAGMAADEVLARMMQVVLRRGRRKLSRREDAYPSDERIDVMQLLSNMGAIA